MSIVAYKAGEMAADSCSFSGGRRYPSEPKIVKSDLGLFGTVGRNSDGYLARGWFRSGMPTERPEFSDEKDDELHIMWVKPDGTVWWADKCLSFTPMPWPTSIGNSTAIYFVEAAMLAGMTAGDAVALGIQHCVWIGGAVQVERIG